MEDSIEVDAHLSSVVFSNEVCGKNGFKNLSNCANKLINSWNFEDVDTDGLFFYEGVEKNFNIVALTVASQMTEYQKLIDDTACDLTMTHSIKVPEILSEEEEQKQIYDKQIQEAILRSNEPKLRGRAMAEYIRTKTVFR